MHVPHHTYIHSIHHTFPSHFTQDEPIMEPCFNVLAFDVRNNKPLNRRKGYDNPNDDGASTVKHRALPETSVEVCG